MTITCSHTQGEHYLGDPGDITALLDAADGRSHAIETTEHAPLNLEALQ